MVSVPLKPLCERLTWQRPTTLLLLQGVDSVNPPICWHAAIAAESPDVIVSSRQSSYCTLKEDSRYDVSFADVSPVSGSDKVIVDLDSLASTVASYARKIEIH